MLHKINNFSLLLLILVLVELCLFQTSSSQESNPKNSTSDQVLPKPPKQDPSKQQDDDCSGLECSCVPMLYCVNFYDDLVSDKSSFCRTKDKAIGVKNCNAQIKAVEDASTIVVPPKPSEEPIKDTRASSPSEGNVKVPPAEADKGIQTASEVLKDQTKLEKKLKKEGITVSKDDTSDYSYLQFFQTSSEAQDIAKIAYFQEQTACSIRDGMDITVAQVRSGLPKTSIEAKYTCPPIPVCRAEDHFYRRYDGSCNNFVYPDWGKAYTPLIRVAPASYSDGINTPRKSVTGEELPSARLVSYKIVTDVNSPSYKFTLSVMQWGQFIDHDLTHSPIYRFGKESGIQCCDPYGQPLPASTYHPECLPIIIPWYDPFYSYYRQTCMNFVRSLIAPDAYCRVLGPRNQMNQKSHYLDGSAIYGTSEKENIEIREFKGGCLKMGLGDMLPTPASYGHYRAGDDRINMHPHLTVVHTLWFRQHNLVAKTLGYKHPDWNDEKLFQEARRIVCAQMQHITYNEWLPIILGLRTMEDYGLFPKSNGYLYSYSSSINAGIWNEFAAAAFRFGHSLIQGDLKLYDDADYHIGTVRLSDWYNRSELLETPPYNIDWFLRGLYKQEMQSFDEWVVDDVTHYLFKTRSMPYGLDLISLNIQRGRDHGLGSYNVIREYCGLPKAKSFEDLRNSIKEPLIPSFQYLYADVGDIDFYVAGLSEFPYLGGVVGETFNCIIAKQFYATKYGDRFYYENGGLPSSFTDAQLYEIRKTSWARIICDNTPYVKEIQPLAFRLADEYNTKVSCESYAIPKVDYTKF